MSEHEHADLCDILRSIGCDGQCYCEDAAAAIDSLHERIAVLEAALILTTAPDLYHGARLGVDSVIAELSGSLSPASAAGVEPGAGADAGASSPTPGVMYADERPGERGRKE